LLNQLAALEKQIRAAIYAVMPSLLELPGVGPIVAGVLLAETGDPKRFASPHHFASYCGAAPVERGSGQNRRMQINPGGNRRLNWAPPIVAMVRLRMDGADRRSSWRKRSFVERRSDLPSDFLKPTSLVNYFEFSPRDNSIRYQLK
jgi:transposase